MARPMHCLSVNQDDCFRINPTISLDPNENAAEGIAQRDVIAVAVTLATATANATYVSLTLNAFAEAISSDNLTNLDLSGTA